MFYKLHIVIVVVFYFIEKVLMLYIIFWTFSHLIQGSYLALCVVHLVCSLDRIHHVTIPPLICWLFHCFSDSIERNYTSDRWLLCTELKLDQQGRHYPLAVFPATLSSHDLDPHLSEIVCFLFYRSGGNLVYCI